MDHGELAGKCAIVTGAAGGFGEVLVQAFLEAGARVAALDIDDKRLDALRAKLHANHAGALMTQHCDIGEYTQCERALAQTKERFGGVHILINNAALGQPVFRNDVMQRGVDIEEISPAMWQRFVAVNFSGAWNLTRAAIGTLRAQRWGRIINVTTSFFTMLRGGFQPYGPCKAGLEAMSCAHAHEFEGSGVTVNVVVPGGPADTPMVPHEWNVKREDLVQPKVMAPPMLFLCSESADGISGNRYIAANWDTTLPSAQAEARCRTPIAWPQLAQNPVWPGGRPKQ